jgi:NTP pyrophosphatase (non-canonical NTP hydrolase)
MSLKHYQKEADDFAQGFAEPYWPPLSQFARIAEEVGELGRILNHLYGSKPKKKSEIQQELGEEIADILVSLIFLANSQGIDLEAELKKALAKSRSRDKDRFERKV